MKKLFFAILILNGVCAKAQKGFFMYTKPPAAVQQVAKWNFSLTAQAVAGWNNAYYATGNTTTVDLANTDVTTGWTLSTHKSDWELVFGSFYGSNSDGGSDTPDSTYGTKFPSTVVAGTLINGNYYTQMMDGLYPFSFDNLPSGTYQLEIMCSEKLSAMGGPNSADVHIKFGSTGDNIYTSGTFPSGTNPIQWPFGSNTNKILTFIGNIGSGQSLRFGIFRINGVNEFGAINSIILTKIG